MLTEKTCYSLVVMSVATVSVKVPMTLESEQPVISVPLWRFQGGTESQVGDLMICH